ncbi:MAG: hypothetical protein IIA49_13050 [Bacteroidetes bacterium]|nr:hypothetical protein [Bacteroidota bacterium]MCH7771923.1 hypothetical protein [Bacteroidota bacterium]
MFYRRILWKKRYSRPSSVIFSDPNGLSVERDGDRTEDKVMDFFVTNNFFGYLIKLNAGACRQVNTYPLPKPSKHSDYHSEIHDSENQILISDDKREALAKITEEVGHIKTKA